MRRRAFITLLGGVAAGGARTGHDFREGHPLAAALSARLAVETFEDKQGIFMKPMGGHGLLAPQLLAKLVALELAGRRARQIVGNFEPPRPSRRRWRNPLGSSRTTWSRSWPFSSR